MLRHLRIPVYHVLQPRSEKARSNRLSFCKALGHLLIIFSHCRVGTQWWFLCCYLQLHSRNFTIFKLVFFLLNERTRVLDSFLSNETIFLWVSSYVFRWVSFVLMFLTVLLSCDWLFYNLFSMALLSCSPFQVSNVPMHLAWSRRIENASECPFPFSVKMWPHIVDAVHRWSLDKVKRWTYVVEISRSVWFQSTSIIGVD